MAKATSDSGLWIMPAPPKPAKAAAGSAGTSLGEPSAAASAPLKGAAGGATVWLDGNVLTCACPDCGAPISIRLWLMLADCWRCGTSVELTEEQQRLAQQLLDKANKSAAVAAPVAPVPAKPQPAKPLTAAIIEPPKPRSTVPVAAIAAPPVVARNCSAAKAIFRATAAAGVASQIESAGRQVSKRPDASRSAAACSAGGRRKTVAIAVDDGRRFSTAAMEPVARGAGVAAAGRRGARAVAFVASLE